MVSIPALRFLSLQPLKAKATPSFSGRTQQPQKSDCFVPRPRFGTQAAALESLQGHNLQQTIDNLLARADFLRNPNPENRDNVVTKVMDGDTFTIEVKERKNQQINIRVPKVPVYQKEPVHKETIRLFGTDAQEVPPALPKKPTTAHFNKIAKIEALQPYGTAAKEKLQELVEGKPVKIYVKDIDHHNRLVAGAKVDKRPLLPGGWVDVAEELLKEGLTMAYPASAQLAEHRQFIEKTYIPLQKAAKAAGVGMFQDPDPMAPWDYRKEHKPGLVLGG